MLNDVLAAALAPLWRALRGFLGMCVTCAGFGCALTALALMDVGFWMLVVVIVFMIIGLVGVAMAPLTHIRTQPPSFRDELARRRDSRMLVD